ncbi:MAG: bifunctional 4-hydroxy-3-methylbut-2-enyl diphosphate reductase/30S ribosomal protein S1 [Ruminococcaceae bacterium]|nr:bifunctional 4-hydroxy-3-methylbut-2-enyl diphosphate reductase/30S ribosomal protein S1 [Oscillospiraceae bacterium]
MREKTVTVAKTIGFCFGVDRAIKICEKLGEEGKNVFTLGPIIHNSEVVRNLEKKGIVAIDSLEEAGEGTVVIRSHGVPPSVYETAEKLKIDYEDATCPVVSKIHSIVNNASTNNKTVLIAGNPNHPEVIGIAGYCEGANYIFKDEDSLCDEVIKKTGDIPVIMVAQTTFNLLQYSKCAEIARSFYSDIEVHNTICAATVDRQNEALELGMNNDVCVVVGGKNSSNTQKLVDICRSRGATTYFVEKSGDLESVMFKGVSKIGVTAGASTPTPLIEEVLTRMSELIKEEEFNFEEALEDSLKPITRNQRVKGVVTHINPNEVVVDIGSKHTGIIPADELSDDSSAKIEDIVKVGDELDLLVMKTNDQEGITTLSKKRVDTAVGMDFLMQAADEGEVLKAKVTELVNKGLIVVINGVRVFVPASQATLRRGESYDNLLNTEVRVKMLEVNPARRRAIASIRAVLQEEIAELREKFWSTVEEGKEYRGVVKSLTSYGAFVDLGGVDGMIHISELSWQRIKSPAEVVSVGDEVDVYVKEIDRDRMRISLGYRKEEDNPWEMLKNSHEVGDIFKAPVVSTTKFGAFVRIVPGIDGLVHISEISDEHVEKVTDYLDIGETVDVKLIGVDYDRRRVSLSMKFEGATPVARKRKSEPEENDETIEDAQQSDSSVDEAVQDEVAISAEPESDVVEEIPSACEIVVEEVAEETEEAEEAIAEEAEAEEATAEEAEDAEENEACDLKAEDVADEA